jgi:hypothetical protein
MNESEHVALIKKRLAENAYFVNPHSDAIVSDDISFLLSTITERDEKISKLQKKNDVLANQVVELTTEMENVKSDFGTPGR